MLNFSDRQNNARKTQTHKNLPVKIFNLLHSYN